MSQFSEHSRPGQLKTAADARARTREAPVDEKPFRLAKSFSLVSIIMIFAAVMILAAVVSRQAEVIITKRVEDDTLKLMENLNHQMYENFLKVVHDPDGKSRLQDTRQRVLLNTVIRNTIYGFDLKRVLIYADNGKVVYDTDQPFLTSPADADDPEAIAEALRLYVPLRKIQPAPPLSFEEYRHRFLYRQFPPYGPRNNRLPFFIPYTPPDFEPEKSPENGEDNFFGLPGFESSTSYHLEFDLSDGAVPQVALNLAKDEQPAETSGESASRAEGRADGSGDGADLRQPHSEEDYLEKIRAQTVFRYEGGSYFLVNLLPTGNFVLRSYKAMEDYGPQQGVSGILEIDRDLTPEYRQIARLQYFALSVAAFLALVLTIGLRWVVSRGEDIITKRNLERQALREQLEQAERLAGLGSMVATVAHEIRNPLGIIHSTADVLNRFLADEPDRARLAQAIVEEANRLSDVVTEFLDFARPPTPRLAPVVVEEILEEILALLEVTLARAGVEVRAELRPDPTPIPGDGPMLHRAFLNLLMNSIQAMDDGGLITVRTGLESDPKKGEALVVTISDTGPGLSEETAKKLFSPFYTTKAKGTGLGLVIVRNIIEGHQGEISLKNGPAPATPDDGGPGLTAVIRLKSGPGDLNI